MSRKQIELFKKVKSFTRLGKRDPKDLIASDWSLVPSGGYSDSYAAIHSNELNLTLSYGPNSYPLVEFMDKDIFGGRLELCKGEKKSILSIDGSFDLVFTEDGLIPSQEYYDAIYEIETFRETGALTVTDLIEGKIYISLEDKLFVYLGFETLPNGELAKNPKIQEVSIKYQWATQFSKSYVNIKKEKGLGKTSLISEIVLEDFSDRRWALNIFNNFKDYISTNTKSNK